MSLLDPSLPLRIFERAVGEWREIAVRHARAAGPDHFLGVEHLLHCIRDRSEPIPNITHAMLVIAIRAAARSSAAGGCVASVQAILATKGTPVFRRLPSLYDEKNHD
jgi:hypothetical protein